MSNKVETFFENVGKFFKKFFGKSATWEQKVASTINYAAPVLTEVITLIGGPAAAAAAQVVLAEIQRGFATVASLTTGAVAAEGSTATQTTINELNLLKTNLSSLEAAADIKDTETQAKLSGLVNLIVGEIDAALNEAPAPAAPVAPVGPATPVTPQS